MEQYVVLLRGINVGAHSARIAMTDLKACLEKYGFEGVRTYINSGNVLLSAAPMDSAEIATEIEVLIAKTFGYTIKVVALSRKELQNVVAHAPKGFGTDSRYRYNALFVRHPLTAAEVARAMESRQGVDVITVGPGVVYCTTLVSAITKSSLPKIMGTAMYQNITIRNWNTTSKVCAMLSD